MADVRSTTTYYNLIKYSRGHPVKDVDLATNMDLIDAALRDLDIGAIPMTTSTDPAEHAAVTTAIIDDYSGVIITLTTSGNTQTLESPTTTTAGKQFVVVSDDGNSDTIEVNGITLSASEAQRFIWDGSAWVAVTAVDADDITFTPAGDIAATNVQSAIAELDTEKMARITSVDNEIARFDSTGGDIQGCTSNDPTISDDGQMAVPGKLDIGTTVNLEGTKDEDDMSSNSAVYLATQQSIKAYADLKLAIASDLSDVDSSTNAFANIKQDATESATGVVELATTTEATTGTDTSRAVTAAGVAAKLGSQTDHAVLVGSGSTAAITPLSVGTDNQYLKGNSSADPAFAVLDIVDDTTPQLGGTLDTNSKQVRWSKGADVSSNTATTLGVDGNYFDITGTTTITSIGTLGIGTAVMLHFDGILTLTNSADLVLPSGANINTVAGDEAMFVEYASGDWRCISYTKADGASVIPQITKVSTTTIAFDSSTNTTLYTVPTGKIFVPVMAIIRITADAGSTTVTFGRSTALTDWLGTQTLTNLDTDGDYGIVMPAIATTPSVLKTYVAAVLFDIDVTTANGGATNYVDLFGYLIDA